MRRLITLSVDDQPEISEMMQHLMNKIDPGGTHMTANTAEQAFKLLSKEVQIVFLDVEMPGINGIDLAKKIKDFYPKLNIIFVTGFTKYCYEAYGVHSSGYLRKPVFEEDLRRELQNLRYPIDAPQSRLLVQCSPFTVFDNGKAFVFHRSRTLEMFAYLVYRNGALCSNGELLGILWDGDPDKQGYLRQLIKDMIESLDEIGERDLIEKKYGKIGIKHGSVRYEGELETIADEFLWL